MLYLPGVYVQGHDGHNIVLCWCASGFVYLFFYDQREIRGDTRFAKMLSSCFLLLNLPLFLINTTSPLLLISKIALVITIMINRVLTERPRVAYNQQRSQNALHLPCSFLFGVRRCRQYVHLHKNSVKEYLKNKTKTRHCGLWFFVYMAYYFIQHGVAIRTNIASRSPHG